MRRRLTAYRSCTTWRRSDGVRSGDVFQGLRQRDVERRALFLQSQGRQNGL